MGRYRVGLETRQRILAATRELLTEIGLEGLTLQAITDRAGVGAGSFYNLFESKEQVIIEVVRQAITAVDPDPSGSGRETLEELVDAFVAFVTGEQVLATIYLQLAMAGGLTDERVAAGVRRSHERRVDRFSRALRRDRPGLSGPAARDEAERMLACLTGFAIHWLYDRAFPFRAAADDLLDGRDAATT